MSQYVLPPLPYDYAALEPHLARRIVQLHHDMHHAAYVKNANAALEKLDAARKNNDYSAIPALERALAFNLSGHVLHSIYWRNLTPNGGGEPTGELKDAIDGNFGSFAAFRRHMTEAAMTVMGSGWAALVWEPVAGRLLVTQVYDHQSNVSQAGVPIMVMDAWEHAWYLQNENRKAEHFEALWNLWNWSDIAERLAAAKRVGVQLADAVSG